MCSGNSADGCCQPTKIPAILEGAWDRDKLVLMSFPDKADSRLGGFAGVSGNSKDRKAGAQGIVLLAKGFA